MAAAADSLEVSSTNATVAQVQSSTETYPEGAAAAEAAILQPDSTHISEPNTKPRATTSRRKYTTLVKASTYHKDVQVSNKDDIEPAAIVCCDVTPDAKSTS
eukprot:8826661-Ditylum_brightwellii.AAC.1